MKKELNLKRTLATWILEAILNDDAHKQTILSNMTVDYHLIEHILDTCQEGCYVEFKNGNGTAILIGKSDSKVTSRQISPYY